MLLMFVGFWYRDCQIYFEYYENDWIFLPKRSFFRLWKKDRGLSLQLLNNFGSSNIYNSTVV